nr:MAG TPA: hypothetical protein [Caudoviricetes sp.]
MCKKHLKVVNVLWKMQCLPCLFIIAQFSQLRNSKSP